MTINAISNYVINLCNENNVHIIAQEAAATLLSYSVQIKQYLSLTLRVFRMCQ